MAKGGRRVQVYYMKELDRTLEEKSEAAVIYLKGRQIRTARTAFLRAATAIALITRMTRMNNQGAAQFFGVSGIHIHLRRVGAGT